MSLRGWAIGVALYVVIACAGVTGWWLLAQSYPWLNPGGEVRLEYPVLSADELAAHRGAGWGPDYTEFHHNGWTLCIRHFLNHKVQPPDEAFLTNAKGPTAGHAIGYDRCRRVLAALVAQRGEAVARRLVAQRLHDDPEHFDLSWHAPSPADVVPSR